MPCDKATRGASASSKLTLEFLILTAARSGLVPATMALTLTVTHHAALHCDGKVKVLAMQNLAGEVQWPGMISEEQTLEYFWHCYDGPPVGQGDYGHLHGA